MTPGKARIYSPQPRSKGSLVSVSVSANFEGLKGLKRFNAADLIPVFTELLLPVQENAQILVRKKTHRLMNSIRIDVRTSTKTRLIMGVTAGGIDSPSYYDGSMAFVDYAGVQEFGDRGSPYLRPAWDANKTEIWPKMKAAIAALVAKNTRKR